MSLNFYNTKIGNYFKTSKNRKRKNLLKRRGGGTGENIKKESLFGVTLFKIRHLPTLPPLRAVPSA